MYNKITIAAFCIFSFLINYNGNALNEVENNNHLYNANYTIEDSTMYGTEGAANDTSDYFYSVPTDDGTIKMYFTYTSTSTTSDFYVYVYNKNGSNIGSKFSYNVGIGTFNDSLTVYCRQQDTIYFRIVATGIIPYNFTYNTIPSGSNDVEPNNNFAQANFALYSDTIKGRVGYKSVATDPNDYFITSLPSFGTINLYIEYNNTSGSTSGDFYSYVYNKNGSQIGYSFKYNQPLGKSYDTITIYCRELDSIYFRFSSSGCFSYKAHYEIYAPTQNDIEPNNAFADANWFNQPDTVEGRIGYTAVSTDPNDYFYTMLPDDGTIEYVVKYINTSNSTSSDFFSYIYNKNGSQIGYSFLYNQPLGVNYDTIRVYCRAKDTVYFRIASSGCFSYEFNYKIISHGTADVEPNNSFVEANYFLDTDTVKGRIGDKSIATDANDYFFSVLPNDGTIEYVVEYNNTSNSTSSNFFSYIYNKNGGLIGNSYLYNQALGVNYDTIRVYCRAQDTVFFRISSSGCFSYEFNYKVITHGTADVEPNNSIAEANYFLDTDTVKGRIGDKSIATDANDYFFSVLPDDGNVTYILKFKNTSNSIQSDIFTYIYNKNGQFLKNNFNYNVPIDTIIYDTVKVNCRLADTLYFRITSNGCFSYEFYYTLETAGTNDIEPNDSKPEATFINLADTLEGRIGHQSIQVDRDDYYKFYNAEYSSIESILTLNNTSGFTNGTFNIYLYNSAGATVFTKFKSFVPLGISVDTLQMDCLPADTFYLRVYSLRCRSYQMDFDVESRQPNANIRYSRYGDNLAFMAEVGTNDSVYWDFGDTTYSSLFFPEKTFGIGVFDVILKSFNKACQVFDSDTVQVMVNGIEYYTPQKAGTDDDFIGFFNLRIFGGGLDTLAIVELIQGGNAIKPFMIGSPDGAELNLLFSFKDFNAYGKYDLNITLSSGDSYSFPDGFELFEDQPGFDIKTAVLGPDRIRTNRWTDYKLVVENDRARIANGVMVGIVIPRYVETNFYQIFLKKTGKYVIKGSEWDKLEIDKDDFNNIYFQGNFNPLIDTVEMVYDSIYAAIDSVNLGIDIDSLYGDPLEASFFPIYIPMVPSESSITIEFKLKSSQNSNSAFIYSYAWPYNFRDNPPSGETLEWIHEGGMQAAALAELAPNPALKFVGKNAGKIDIASKVVFTEFFDWYYDANNADAGFYAEIGVDVAFEVGGELIPFGKNGDKAKESADRYRRRMKNQTENLQMLESIAKNGKMHPNMAKRVSDRIQQYKDKIKQLGEFATDNEKYAAMEELKSYLSGRGMDLTNKQLKKLLFPKETKTNKPKRTKRKPVRSVTSLDPNAIYGNYGPTSKNYISKTEQLNYLVTFENVDTALAPAQIVKINLQLDTNVFDIKKTTLSNISISGKPYTFEQDRSQYYTNIDLRPEKDIVVRVNANIDTITGFMEWQFTSLEPLTGELLIDAFDGFLPPNVNFPEGEGSVTFNTFLKESVKNEDSIGAIAAIYFDENDVILTNIYTNHVDEKSPQSTLSATINITNDSIMELSYSGTDGESGIVDYFLKAKVNNDDWIGADFPVDISGTTTVLGSPGNTYSFYVFAQDSVGNVEQKTLVVEATVTLEGATDSPFGPSFQLFPNPSNGDVFIKSNGNFYDMDVVISDVMGRVVEEYKLDATLATNTFLDFSNYSNGTYFIYFKTVNGKVTSNKLVLFKNK